MKDPFANKILRGFDREGQDKIAEQASTNPQPATVSSSSSDMFHKMLSKLNEIENPTYPSFVKEEEVEEDMLAKKQNFPELFQKMSENDSEKEEEEEEKEKEEKEEQEEVEECSGNGKKKKDMRESTNKAQREIIESHDIMLDSAGSFVSNEERALHGICSKGIHYLIHEDGSFIEGQSINDLLDGKWMYETPHTEVSESKLDMKALARLIESVVGNYDNPLDRIMNRGLAIASEKIHIHPMEAINLTVKKYLHADNFHEYLQLAEFNKMADNLTVILEAKASFAVDDPMANTIVPKEFNFKTDDPDIAKWRGAAASAKQVGTSPSARTRSELGATKDVQNVRQAWKELLAQYRRMQHSPQAKMQIEQKLKKLMQLAKQRGIELTDAPATGVQSTNPMGL